jgi:hypothetical protein
MEPVKSETVENQSRELEAQCARYVRELESVNRRLFSSPETAAILMWAPLIKASHGGFPHIQPRYLYILGHSIYFVI